MILKSASLPHTWVIIVYMLVCYIEMNKYVKIRSLIFFSNCLMHNIRVSWLSARWWNKWYDFIKVLKILHNKKVWVVINQLSSLPCPIIDKIYGNVKLFSFRTVNIYCLCCIFNPILIFSRNKQFIEHF